MTTGNNPNAPTEISMDDLLEGLEGEDALEFTASVGIEAGIYTARIRDLHPGVKDIRMQGTDEVTQAKVAVFDLELTDPRYSGWTRQVSLFIGKNPKTGEWADGVFRASVRNVLGEEGYDAHIKPLASAGEQYKKAFDVLKGMDCRVRFAPSKNDATKIYPTGALQSAEEPTRATGSTGGTEL